MPKNKLILIIFGTLTICVASVGFFVLASDSGDSSGSQPEVGSDAALDLGITYVTLNEMMAECYSVDFDCGALLTDVGAGGLAHQAGMKAGDVILSCNGVQLDESTPLLGVLREQERAGGTVTLEVARGTRVETVQIYRDRVPEIR